MAEIFSVSNAAELSAALASAQGGDRIELAGGDYGKVSIANDFASDVTIVSADPDDPAIFGELHINGATHIVFDGLLLDYIHAEGDAAWVTPFTVTNSSFVTIRNSVIDGDLVGGFGYGKGLLVKHNNNITIENNEIFNFQLAISVGNSSDVVVRANDIHSVRSEGLNSFDVHGLLVEGNWIHDFKTNPALPEHPDMIQFWNVVEGQFSENVTIRGNFLDSGDGNWTQNILITNTAPTMTPAEYHQNFLIEDNIIYNAQIHGISVYQNIDGVQILNNTLLYNLDADAGLPGSGAPRINLGGTNTSLNVVIEGNIAEHDVTLFQPLPYQIGSNYLVQHSNPNGASYYGNRFVNALVDGPGLADLRALPGGEIETLGVGAEMTRSGIDITLTAGPAH